MESTIFQVQDGIAVFACVNSTLRCHLVASCCLSHRFFLPFNPFHVLVGANTIGLGWTEVQVASRF